MNGASFSEEPNDKEGKSKECNKKNHLDLSIVLTFATSFTVGAILMRYACIIVSAITLGTACWYLRHFGRLLTTRVKESLMHSVPHCNVRKPLNPKDREAKDSGDQMKRLSIQNSNTGEEAANKKKRLAIPEKDISPSPAAELSEDLVCEVLKRADARTLGRAACVSRRWRGMAEDERLWEEVCTPHWANIGCGNRQLRSVVLALGGFRRLHSLYMVPLRTAAAPTAPPVALPLGSQQWGKDEIQLSLSLLSIGFFERMNPGFPPEKGVAPAGLVE